MVRDLGMAKQRLVAIQNYLLTLAPQLHSPSIPLEHLPETVCGSLKPFLLVSRLLSPPLPFWTSPL